jgi:release factor glutamine methyltransferase
MDISKDALDMAKKNATRHFIFEKVRFILGDICKDMPHEKFDVILSNPPYIPSRDIENLSDEVKKEPLLALDGGEDGLDIIRFLTCDGLSYLNENGKMLIEFGYDQGEIMDTLLDKIKKEGKISSYEIIRDYSKNPRLCVIYK